MPDFLDDGVVQLSIVQQHVETAPEVSELLEGLRAIPAKDAPEALTAIIDVCRESGRADLIDACRTLAREEGLIPASRPNTKLTALDAKWDMARLFDEDRSHG